MERPLQPPLSDEQLSNILDGTAPGDVVDRLARDPDSAARLQAWQRWNEQMQEQLLRWDCPSSQQLADYHWGDADRTTAQTIARHLATCVRCTEEIETLRAFLAEDIPQPVSPPQSTPNAVRSPTRRLRELIAAIVPRVPGLAVRGTDTAPIVAEAGDVTLVLDVQGNDDGSVTVLGQIAAPDPDRWTGALVEVRQGGVVRAVDETDDVGSFRCAALPPSASELRVTTPDGTSVMLALDLGNREQGTGNRE